MERASRINSYKDLEIWQRSEAFAVFLYKTTRDFPRIELYALTNQMRRAAVSILSNIAEGFRRKSKLEKLQFLRIAYGSGAELETQLEISRDLEYLSEDAFSIISKELDEIMRMTNKTISSLESQT